MREIQRTLAIQGKNLPPSQDGGRFTDFSKAVTD